MTSIAALMITIAMSAEPVKLPSVNTLRVIYKVARQFNVDAQDLVKIAFVESSFRMNTRRANTNGTVDYGMFQINSVHWSTICRTFDIFKLTGNTRCAAKLIAIAKRHSQTDRTWLGRYHSKTPSLKDAYYAKLETIEFRGD